MLEKANRKLLRKNSFISMLSIALLCCLLVLSIVLTGCGDTANDTEASGNSDVEKITFNGVELFYTSSVPKDEAQKLADYLLEIEFYPSDGKEIQMKLNKNDDIYELIVPIMEGAEIDEEYKTATREIAEGLSKDVFEGAKVDIHLIDGNSKTLSVISVYGLNSVSQLAFNGGVLYYYPTISETEANDLKEYLDNEELFVGNEVDIFVDKNEQAYEISFVLADSTVEPDESSVLAFRIFSGGVSNNVLNGAKVDLTLCDDELNPLYEITSENAISQMNFNGGTVYYLSTVSQAEVEEVGNYFVEIGFFGEEEVEVLFFKEENTYGLSFVIDEGMEQDEEIIQVFKEIGQQLSNSILNENRVSIIFIDENFNILKEIQ